MCFMSCIDREVGAVLGSVADVLYKRRNYEYFALVHILLTTHEKTMCLVIIYCNY